LKCFDQLLAEFLVTHRELLAFTTQVDKNFLLPDTYYQFTRSRYIQRFILIIWIKIDQCLKAVKSPLLQINGTNMADNITRSMLIEVMLALGLPAKNSRQIDFVGDDRLPSCFPVSQLAAASIGAAAGAVSELIGLVSAKPTVVVSHRLASLWFGWSIRPIGWAMPNPWDDIAGDYKTQDGWIKIHTNTPYHRAAALAVLGCKPDRKTVANNIATWTSSELENAIVTGGGCAARLATEREWLAHPQGVAVASEPLVRWEKPTQELSSNWQPTSGRPLAGLRVLDLTRVIAGPVATRFLAGFGADVLRIDPRGWDEPGVVPEVTLGKRCATLDLKSVAGRETFIDLLAKADVLVHGYRSDALEMLGLGAAVRQAIAPGLIDISLDAYGHTGPWAKRRGFDSLVQFSSGISSTSTKWRGTITPTSLPVQALDHATGYLLAAAAVRGLMSRLTGTGPICARLSLARTAKLLTDHKAVPTSVDFRPLRDSDFLAAIENTDWGPCQRLVSPVTLQSAALFWDKPATKLGSAKAAW
jgi:CoA-transferase family III